MLNPYDAQFNDIREKVISYAKKYGIDPGIAVWQIWQESKFKPGASSGKANGIAQFTPATAARFGVRVWDVDSSLDGWGRYMTFLLGRFNKDYSLALAGYNAGEGSVSKYGGIPPYRETQNYVKTIMNSASSSADSSPDGAASADSSPDGAAQAISSGVKWLLLLVIVVVISD